MVTDKLVKYWPTFYRPAGEHVEISKLAAACCFIIALSGVAGFVLQGYGLSSLVYSLSYIVIGQLLLFSEVELYIRRGGRL